jgi:uncharacterized protein YggE
MGKNELSIKPSVAFLAFPVLIALALAFVGYALLQSAPQSANTITVTASGSVTAVPAEAQLSIGLNSTGATAAEAVSRLSLAASALNTTLLPLLNGNVSDIQTQSYSVFVPPRCSNSSTYYGQANCIQANAPIYYVAQESLSITLPNVNNVTAALSGASLVSGVSISGVSARLSAQQQAGMMQQALSMALDNATSQAQAVADGAQVEVQSITVQNGYIFFSPASSLSALTSSAPSSQTFFPGTATVAKSVYVVFKAER